MPGMRFPAAVQSADGSQEFPAISVGAGAALRPDGPDGADAVRICAGCADHGHGDARRGARATAGRRNRLRPGWRHAGAVLRHSGRQAQRPARPPGIAAGNEGESARIDDDRAGRDAVRLHLRHQGPARRNQGAARAAPDPGAQGRDARRRVLREEEPPARQLVNALAEAGRGWSPGMGTNDPLYSHIDALVHRILDGFTDNLAIFDEAREKLESFLADEEQAAETNIQSTADEIDQEDRKQLAACPSRRPRSSGASRCTRSRTSSRGSCASSGSHMLEDVYLTARRGKRVVGAEHRDARGPRLERAAETDQGRSEASGRAAAGAVEAACRGRCRTSTGPRRARAVHGESGRGARGVGEAVARIGGARDGRRRRAGEGGGRGGEGGRRRGEGGAGRSAGRGDDAGRARAGERDGGDHRRRVPRDRAEPGARRMDRVRGRRRPARLRQAGVDQSVARAPTCSPTGRA